MTYVLDASAALEIAFNGPKAARYKELLENAKNTIAMLFLIL